MMEKKEQTEYEKYIKSLEEELLEELPNSYFTDDKKESKSRNKEKNEIEQEKVYLRERKIIKVPVYVINTGKDKKGIPIQMTALLLGAAVLAGASFYQKKGNDIKFPFISNLLDQKQDGQNKNGTGNINDRVYLSEDMTKVTIRDDNGKETKTFDFSEEARYYLKQIIQHNTFESKDKDRLAFIITSLMMLDKNIVYKLGGGSNQYKMDIEKYNDCARYVGHALWYATGYTLPDSNNKIGRTITGTILSENNGKQISPENCRPGDCKLKNTIASGGSNHVVIFLGKLDDGKEYMIDCSRRGVTVRPDTNYPVCIRLDRLNTDEILMSKNNGEEIGLYSFDTNQFLISKNDRGEER